MLEADEDEDEDESDSDSDSDADENEVREGLMDVDDEDREIKRQRKAEKAAEGDWTMDGDDGFPRQLLSFDIYLKGNVSKANTFFKNVGSTTQRFRMFPYVEKKRRVDEYGETIDVGMWLRKGKVFEEEAESEEVKTNRKKHEEAEAQVGCHTESSFCSDNE
jgi:cleavage and polyadenylation specificity factor subunit 2